MFTRMIAFAIVAGCSLGLASRCHGQTEATIAARDSGISEFVTGIVKTHLPDAFEKKKNWGATTEVWDGVHLKLDGVKLRTKRKTRTVNHGTWTMYRATLARPEELAVKVSNIRRQEDGRTGFDAEFFAPLDVFARLSEWQRGVQLISLSADAQATVRLRVSCAVGTKLETAAGNFVPDVVIEPEVLDARVLLEDFQLHRVSKLHGPLVDELGEELHGVLQREIDDRNHELVAKMNRQIAKRQEKLRLSLSELASSKFGDLREWVK